MDIMADNYWKRFLTFFRAGSKIDWKTWGKGEGLMQPHPKNQTIGSIMIGKLLISTVKIDLGILRKKSNNMF